MKQFDENILKQKIKEWGADIVGFADLKEVLSNGLKHLPVGISIGVRLSNEIIKGIIEGPTILYAYHYTISNDFLNEIALRTTNYLQSFGFDAIPVPASQNTRKTKLIFPHKTTATCAGLGWIGKSNLLIHPKYGPRVRYVTVLTNAEINNFGKTIVDSNCKGCKKCVKACPVGAIIGVNWKRGMKREDLFIYEKCWEQIDKNEKTVGKPVCGICISTCPIGLKSVEKN